MKLRVVQQLGLRVICCWEGNEEGMVGSLSLERDWLRVRASIGGVIVWCLWVLVAGDGWVREGTELSSVGASVILGASGLG